MKIETLKERIEKATAKIEKKQNTIVKKTAQIEKKRNFLEKLGFANYTRQMYYEVRNTLTDEVADDLYWTICDIDGLEDDIERNKKEIEETKKTIEKYNAQLAGEIEKESIFLKEIPESMKLMQTQLVEKWDEWDKERREFVSQKYRELGYTAFFKKYNYSDYELMYESDEHIHESNMNDAKMLILNLYNRVKAITGEVTDWTEIRLTSGNMGPVLNGIVYGKEGRANVESILAGGYNIQRLHVRVLVHEIR